MVVGVGGRHLVHVKLGLPPENNGVESRLLASVVPARLGDEVEVGGKGVVLRPEAIVGREWHRRELDEGVLLQEVAALLDAIVLAIVLAGEVVAVIQVHVTPKHLDRGPHQQVLVVDVLVLEVALLAADRGHAAERARDALLLDELGEGVAAAVVLLDLEHLDLVVLKKVVDDILELLPKHAAPVVPLPVEPEDLVGVLEKLFPHVPLGTSHARHARH
mmetsp:Transcript_31454/g.79151  ORF Transcript_31454/g.79151 Transcript_31454/m.79151 type:complete len:218 (-) Transcript_31454:776-1429(-)